MAIPKNIMNEMVKKLAEDRLTNEFYDGIEELLSTSLNNINLKYHLGSNATNFFIAGDHMLSTNIATTSPLVIFVSLKQNKEAFLNYKKWLNLSKRAKKILPAPKIDITDEILAQELLQELLQQLDETDKLFASKNIIMVNLSNIIKLKIIVGYYFDSSFEYEYLGKLKTENVLDLIEKFDEKQKHAPYFYDLVRIIKSIELELLSLGYQKQKSYDILYFMEYLVYNVPNELLNGESFYDAFLKSITYLKNADFNNFKLIDNAPMFLNTEYNVILAKQLILLVEHFYNNFETLILNQIKKP